MYGLKDHHIANLISDITNHLKRKNKVFNDYGPLRELVAEATMEFLMKRNLRIDGQNSKQQKTEKKL